ncbi:unnamed protein product [Schistocephalus solidus]|uniref:ANF_receptor domain-containing protein n=1 Tax=Schistocephalus solidus TaxID=70667 RepID=A0A183SVL4_SCHSO|nr:unnamed protein product [Schistocephalus solidus]
MAEASNPFDAAAGITISLITAASCLTPSEDIGSRLVRAIAAEKKLPFSLFGPAAGLPSSWLQRVLIINSLFADETIFPQRCHSVGKQRLYLRRSHRFFFKCLAFLACVLVYASAQGPKEACEVHRPPSAKGNFTNEKEIREQFFRLSQQCNRVNGRRLRKATNKLLSPQGHPIPTVVNLGVQLAVEGRDCFAQLLPAIDVAIEKVSNLPPYLNVTFRVVPILYLDWLACDSLAILEQFNKGGVHVVFGPLNDFVLGASARFSTAQYSIPIVSPSASAVTLSDKHEFEMLTRMFYTYTDLKWVFDQTLQKFNWKPSSTTPIAMLTILPESFEDGFNAGLDSIFQKQAVFKTLASYKALTHDMKRLATSAEYKYSAEAAEMEVITLPGLARVNGPDLRSVKEFRPDESRAHLQFVFQVNTVAIPYGGLQPAELLTGFGNPLSNLIVDSRVA